MKDILGNTEIGLRTSILHLFDLHKVTKWEVKSVEMKGNLVRKVLTEKRGSCDDSKVQPRALAY